MENLNVELVPKLQSIRCSIEILAIPGRPIPTKDALYEILNENLDPHLGLKIRRLYVAGQNRNNK